MPFPHGHVEEEAGRVSGSRERRLRIGPDTQRLAARRQHPHRALTPVRPTNQHHQVGHTLPAMFGFGTQVVRTLAPKVALAVV